MGIVGGGGTNAKTLCPPTAAAWKTALAGARVRGPPNRGDVIGWSIELGEAVGEFGEVDLVGVRGGVGCLPGEFDLAVERGPDGPVALAGGDGLDDGAGDPEGGVLVAAREADGEAFVDLESLGADEADAGGGEVPHRGANGTAVAAGAEGNDGGGSAEADARDLAVLAGAAVVGAQVIDDLLEQVCREEHDSRLCCTWIAGDPAATDAASAIDARSAVGGASPGLPRPSAGREDTCYISYTQATGRGSSEFIGREVGDLVAGVDIDGFGFEVRGMDLSLELLARLAGELRSNERAGTERRRSPRVGMRVRAELVGPGVQSEVVWVRDVSATGIGMLTHVPREAGAGLVLPVRAMDGRTTQVRCLVRYCRKVGTDLYHVGAQFTEPVTGTVGPAVRKSA